MAEAKKPTTSAPAKKAAPKVAAPKATAPKVTASKTTASTTTPAKATAARASGAKATPATPRKKAKVPAPKVESLRMHHLRPADGAHTPKTRVGRGEGSKGKTAGRGTKGTGARYQVSPLFEGGQTPILRRIPKLRGFRSPFKVTYQVVNLDTLVELYPKGGSVTKVDLVAKGAVRKNQPVKILGDGDISVKFTVVDADKVSRSALKKIEAAGGSVQAS
jgi:large subunit ribosomal protein L15